MTATATPHHRNKATRARRRPASALLLVLSLGGIGVTLSPVGTQVGHALQAWSSGALGPVVTVTELRQAVARDPGRWWATPCRCAGGWTTSWAACARAIPSAWATPCLRMRPQARPGRWGAFRWYGAAPTRCPPPCTASRSWAAWSRRCTRPGGAR